ncbi:hypothetical protein K474DRAFT_1659713 [Panus rudis PR-1116 ss-1]|nr:hypothetical protein K474DRAFT_1659713 [Panus rudis PR-1116 ss-1]
MNLVSLLSSRLPSTLSLFARMTGNDEYKPIEAIPGATEELTREPSGRSETFWDEVAQYNPIKFMRWKPFIYTGASLLGMYALKYFVVPSSPRTLLRRRIAVGLGGAYLSYSSYWELHVAKEMSIRYEQGRENERGELSPMWVGMLHVLDKPVVLDSEIETRQRDVTFNLYREQYTRFRQLVPAETLSERIFRHTRTWFSDLDLRAAFFSILHPLLHDVGCSPRDIDISISLAALYFNMRTLNPWISEYPYNAAMLGLASQLIIRRPFLIWMSALVGTVGLVGDLTLLYLLRYHLLEEPMTVRRDKWKEIGEVWKKMYTVTLDDEDVITAGSQPSIES